MTEGGCESGEHAPVMASWDDSGPPLENVARPPEPETGLATAVESARRLLEQLLTRRPADDWSPFPKQ